MSPARRKAAARIRPARRPDLGRLVEIEEAAFSADAIDRRAFRHAIASPSMTILVAEPDPADPAGDGVMGYAILERRRGSRTARLTSIAIHPSAVGRGAGADLLAAAEAEARAAGCGRLRLEVRADNEAAIALYGRSGYLRFGEHAGYYEDGTAAWRFEKALE